MGNWFQGFPVPRAKLADYALKTETMSNAYDTKDIFYASFFDSLDGWYQDKGGTGDVVLYANGVEILTGGTAGSFAWMYKSLLAITPALSWSKEVRMTARCRLKNEDGYRGKLWLTTGSFSTEHHAGFYLEDGKLYGSAGNGVALVKTAALLDLSGAPFSQIVALEFKFTPASLTFFLDGVQVAELTTGLPTGTTSANVLASFWVENPGYAQSLGFFLSYLKLFREVS